MGSSEISSSSSDEIVTFRERLFYILLKVAQFTCALCIVLLAVTTTELHGKFFYADEKISVLKLILEPNVRHCNHFIFYKPDDHSTTKLLTKQEEGYAQLKDNNDVDNKGSNGRILAIFDKTAKYTNNNGGVDDDSTTTNSTIGEMKMHIFMLYEWKTGEYKKPEFQTYEKKNSIESSSNKNEKTSSKLSSSSTSTTTASSSSSTSSSTSDSLIPRNETDKKTDNNWPQFPSGKYSSFIKANR